MGMTDDLEVAVAEGATMVRVGRSLFGERPRRDLRGVSQWERVGGRSVRVRDALKFS